MDTLVVMVGITGTMILVLYLLSFTLIPVEKKKEITYFAHPKTAGGQKRAYEEFCLYYSPFWMGAFGIIIAFQLYETFTALSYFVVCFGLCIPLFVFPFTKWVLPSDIRAKDKKSIPFWKRYSTKATVWLIIYSHIGNYWYTHYFYSVLKAKYTMPAWWFNGVPLALYFATFFYFSSYHVFSNLIIRRFMTGYKSTTSKTIYMILLICIMSYITAFMETLTISGFPYYEFEDRNMAYTIGSAFYGIYFLFSFPMFFRLDEYKDSTLSLWQTIVDSMGSGMMILIMLDAVRLCLGQTFTMKYENFFH